MEFDVGSKTGAAPWARRVRIAPGAVQRLPRWTWETRAGTIELRIPKLRKGSCFRASWSPGGSPSFRKLMFKALRPSRSTTWSRLWEDIEERVGAFLDRSLEDDWPYIWIDATYVEVHQNGRIAPPQGGWPRWGPRGLRRRDRRRRRQHRRSERSIRHGGRRLGGRDLLDRVSPPVRPARAALRGLLAASALPIG
jgi:hypothetical protein